MVRGRKKGSSVRELELKKSRGIMNEPRLMTGKETWEKGEIFRKGSGKRLTGGKRKLSQERGDCTKGGKNLGGQFARG